MNFKHGRSKTTIWARWFQMLQRCYNPRNHAYARYGGRGIIVCSAWRASFPQFIADMGEPPSAVHSIDRIDNNGNYEPANCRWATRVEQARNKRTNTILVHEGKSLCVSAWAELTGISVVNILQRIHKMGWSVSEALTRPVRKCLRQR